MLRTGIFDPGLFSFSPDERFRGIVDIHISVMHYFTGYNLTISCERIGMACKNHLIDSIEQLIQVDSHEDYIRPRYRRIFTPDEREELSKLPEALLIKIESELIENFRAVQDAMRCLGYSSLARPA